MYDAGWRIGKVQYPENVIGVLRYTKYFRLLNYYPHPKGFTL